ncbi:MAG TPA: FAD-binding protein [Candidatus Omnitrophica bacterium]|nr:FAD-binding protein [Candidatus Omnitrophota bacterium]
MPNTYDLIIIGAGPGGITAAVYAARKGLKLLVITKDIGGQAALSGNVENYTGYQFVPGPQLAAKFEEHLRKFNFELKESEAVKEVKCENSGYIRIKTDKGIYAAKTAIIATGARWKELNALGEREFKNRGLTYCATCDGPLFRDKTVAVIGGGNSALDAAIQLINIATHVYIINIASNITGDRIMQEKVAKNKKVTIFNNSRVAAISGDKFVNAIVVKRGGKEEKISVQGVFVEIGLNPNSEIIPNIEKNKKGEIEIDKDNHTSIPGIFAAGDVTDVSEKQIIIAAGEGAKAALSAFKYLTRQA